MKIVCISDTHEQHDKLGPLPDGDVLIHAGDLTGNGHFRATRAAWNWLESQPHKYKIWIAGNHDFNFPEKPASLRNSHYLFDSGVEIEGVRFWGSPYTPRFFDWAFMYDRPTKRWNEIPQGTDVLITHGPALGFRDRVGGWGKQCGCADLLDRVLEIKPKLHISGHIHGSYGQERFNGTTFVNASVVNEAYQVVNQPIVIEI